MSTIHHATGASIAPESRYSGSAALLTAIRAAAALAPAVRPESEHAQRYAPTHDGEHITGPVMLRAYRCDGPACQWPRVDAPQWVERESFGPFLPAPDDARVSFAYSCGATRGMLTVGNTRAAIEGLHSKVHAQRAAFDGKTRRAPRPSGRIAALSGPSLLREFARTGERGNALALADIMGAVFFGAGSGGEPNLYAMVEHHAIGAHACAIGLHAHTGAWRVLHVASALSIDGGQGGPGSFDSADRARAWVSERAADPAFVARLDAAASGKAAPLSQEAAREAYAPEETAQDAPAPAAVSEPAPDAARPVAADPAPAPVNPAPDAANDDAPQDPPPGMPGVTVREVSEAEWDAAVAIAQARATLAAARIDAGPPATQSGAHGAPPTGQSEAAPETDPARSLSAPLADALPELVQRAIVRIGTGEDPTGACAWVWSRAEYAHRSRVDAWLVRNGHSLAHLPGTGERRFRLLVDMECDARRAALSNMPPDARIVSVIHARQCAVTARGIAAFTGSPADARTLERITEECNALARSGRLVRFDHSARGLPPAWDVCRTPAYAIPPATHSVAATVGA